MAGVEISKRILLINSASNVVRRILNLTVLLWMHQHLVRNIPAEEYKLQPVLMGVLAATPLLVTVLQGGIGRYLTEAYARGDELRVTQIVSSISPLLWGAVLLLAALGLAFTANIDVFIDIDPQYVELAQHMFLILLGGTLLRVAFQPYLLGFYIRQKLLHRDLLGTFSELCKLILLVVLLTQVSTTVFWVPVATILASTIEMGIVFTISRRLVPALRFKLSAFRRDVLGPVLSFGGWTILGQTSTLLRELADPLILNNLGTAQDVVSFNLGSQPDRQLRRAVFGATSTAQPATTAMVATGQSGRLSNAWFRLTRYSLWAMLGVTLPLMVYRVEFFQLYLKEKYVEYSQASLVMLLLLARYVSISPNATIGLLAIARAEMKAAGWRALGLEVTNVLLTLCLVGFGHLGATGAGVASLVVHGIGHPLLNWGLGLRLAGVSFGEWARVSFLRGLLPGACALPVWLLLGAYVEPDSWASLGLCAAGGFAVYALALWKCLPPADRADALTVVNSTVGLLLPSDRDSVR